MVTMCTLCVQCGAVQIGKLLLAGEWMSWGSMRGARGRFPGDGGARPSAGGVEAGRVVECEQRGRRGAEGVVSGDKRGAGAGGGGAMY